MTQEHVPDRAFEELLRWAGKTEPGDQVFHDGREAVDHLKRIAKQPRR